jgi:hypothetical protein
MLSRLSLIDRASGIREALRETAPLRQLGEKKACSVDDDRKTEEEMLRREVK